MKLCIRVWAVVLIAVVPVSAATPFGADSNDTSVYALGTYVWNVVFLSDAGNGWSQSQINTHTDRVQGAADYWMNRSRDRFVPGAQLDIIVNVVNGGDPRRVSDASDTSGYADALNGALVDNPDYIIPPGSGGIGLAPPNPFTVVSESEPNTTDEFFTFTTSSTYSHFATREFNRFTRDLYGTNWAFTTFVRPVNGRSSAFVNGPYTNAHQDDSSNVYAHEAGHIFGAYDEYSSASSAYVSRLGGYLQTENTNAHWQDREQTIRNWSSTSDSIMKTGGNWTLRSGTANAIGWRDLDNDRIPDILDTFPVIDIDNDLSVPVTPDTVLTGSFAVNPMESPSIWWGAITINTLSSAFLKLRDDIVALAPFEPGVEQLKNEITPLGVDLTPLDGEWGGYEEDFALDLSELNLAPGDHQYLLQVTNSVGNVSEQVLAFTIIPEPTSLALLALGGVMLVRRRNR